ncbi:hypothetical protein HVA01_22610 [Halovibrio variabilis]|uniref:Cupin type-2 domain-containing protein n=1 Tax=Halovibrio variabilis TaxID=31910 RepID=A0A511UPU0_9GAMM|nr:iron-containing redox enzyme family protein [Halovibrio variabilis]GEN28615.1 hypothetical protein HVA01_22610 [Halovibrio variabilis]
MPSIKELISEYSSNPLFRDAEATEILINSGPYRRPTRVNDNAFINFDKVLTAKDIGSNSSLSTHRMLLNIYEADLYFLPRDPKKLDRTAEKQFYNAGNLLAGEKVRPILENKAFSFLNSDISTQGPWNGDMMLTYFNEYLQREQADAKLGFDASPLNRAILNADHPDQAAKHYLIQMAPDFLSESSAMARYSLGGYGQVQSALFNILIDEYGASVHEQKHSSLFEKAMASVDLEPDIHRYWQFYQASSLALTNYFHYVTKNKTEFFRYVGALFFTESSLINVAGNQSKLFKEIFGTHVDTLYFDEHHHIDRHHGDMVLKKLIMPLLNEYGDQVVPDILQGFEEFRYLQQLADEDLQAQIEWAGHINEAIEHGKNLYAQIEDGSVVVPLETFLEANDERSTTHTHPDDRLLVIESGEMDFWPMYGEEYHFRPGDILFVPKHRLHGSVVTSPECVYHQPLVDGMMRRYGETDNQEAECK